MSSQLSTYIPVLNGTNYQEWAARMQSYLMSQCYIRIRPDPDVPREDKKMSPAGSYRLPTPERVPENECKNRGDRRRPELSRRI